MTFLSDNDIVVIMLIKARNQPGLIISTNLSHEPEMMWPLGETASALTFSVWPASVRMGISGTDGSCTCISLSEPPDTYKPNAFHVKSKDIHFRGHCMNYHLGTPAWALHSIESSQNVRGPYTQRQVWMSEDWYASKRARSCHGQPREQYRWKQLPQIVPG